MTENPAGKKLPTGKTLKVTLVRSVASTRESHRATVRGLGRGDA